MITCVSCVHGSVFGIRDFHSITQVSTVGSVFTNLGKGISCSKYAKLSVFYTRIYMLYTSPSGILVSGNRNPYNKRSLFSWNIPYLAMNSVENSEIKIYYCCIKSFN